MQNSYGDQWVSGSKNGSHRCLWATVAMTVVLLFGAEPSYGQKLSLRVEVLIQPTPQQRLQSQEWAQVFQKMGRSPRFRSGEDGERTRVEDSEFRGRKSVTAVGILNRNGSLTFQGQTFVATRPEPLRKWLDRLEQYGAGGPPNESPTWGLTKSQFNEVLSLFSHPVTETVRLTTPVEVIASLKVPGAFRIEFTAAAKKRAYPKFLYTEKSTKDFQGLSKGSVLAMSLAQFGLGFRPKIGQDGRYILEVDAGTEADNMYPVGWKNIRTLTAVVPNLMKRLPVDLEKANLDALIGLIARKLELPHFSSAAWLAAEGKNLATMRYTRKPDKLTMHRLMEIVETKNQIGLDLRTDEAGNVFLWTTTQADQRAFKKRFANVRPAP